MISSTGKPALLAPKGSRLGMIHLSTVHMPLARHSRTSISPGLPPILPYAVRKQADRRGEDLGLPVASLCLLICNLPLAKPGPELQAAEEASCSEFTLRGGPWTRKCELTRQTDTHTRQE